MSVTANNPTACATKKVLVQVQTFMITCLGATLNGNFGRGIHEAVPQAQAMVAIAYRFVCILVRFYFADCDGGGSRERFGHYPQMGGRLCLACFHHGMAA